MTNFSNISYVVTTIQEPTQPLLELATKTSKIGNNFYVVGDKKSPLDFYCPHAKYLSVDSQEKMDFLICKNLPYNSYSRKMIGYLYAIQDGCNWIRETDDDNYPLNSFFDSLEKTVSVREVCNGIDGWVNPYAYFTNKFIWPRGFPIHLLLLNTNNTAELKLKMHKPSEILIFQGLANGEPDVDAIYRLVINNDSKMEFFNYNPIKISKDLYAPFNSQATTWAKSVFPLMYLPVTCTFRMTDIWRSFIAQRILRDISGSIVFTSATVFQKRNPHDLLKDFREEVPGYLENQKLINALDSTKILGGIGNIMNDLRECYKTLISANFLDKTEETVLNSWISDLIKLGW